MSQITGQSPGCARCGRPLPQPKRRHRVYCSARCQQAAWKQRRSSPSAAQEVTHAAIQAEDIRCKQCDEPHDRWDLEYCPACREAHSGAYETEFEALLATKPEGKVPFREAMEMADRHGLLTESMRKEWLQPPSAAPVGSQEGGIA